MPFDLALPTLPPTEVLLSCLAVAAALFVLLAACFGPFLAVFSERLGVTRGRAFYAKAAGQIAHLSLALGTLATAAFAAVLFFALRADPGLLAPPFFHPLLLVAALALFAELFLVLYVLCWPRQGKSGFFHIWLGLKAGGAAACALYLCAAFARRLLHTPPQAEEALIWYMRLLDFFSVPMSSLFWPLLAQSVFLGCAAAGALSSVWLLLMRKRQDYGRDYYNFALPYCARWALWGTLGGMGLGALVLYRGQALMLPELSHAPSLPLAAAAAALPALACLLWLPAIHSKTPLRHKIGVIFACLLLAGGLFAQILILNKILPSP